MKYALCLSLLLVGCSESLDGGLGADEGEMSITVGALEAGERLFFDLTVYERDESDPYRFNIVHGFSHQPPGPTGNRINRVVPCRGDRPHRVLASAYIENELGEIVAGARDDHIYHCFARTRTPIRFELRLVTASDARGLLDITVETPEVAVSAFGSLSTDSTRFVQGLDAEALNAAAGELSIQIIGPEQGALMLDSITTGKDDGLAFANTAWELPKTGDFAWRLLGLVSPADQIGLQSGGFHVSYTVSRQAQVAIAKTAVTPLAGSIVNAVEVPGGVLAIANVPDDDIAGAVDAFRLAFSLDAQPDAVGMYTTRDYAARDENGEPISLRATGVFSLDSVWGGAGFGVLLENGNDPGYLAAAHCVFTTDGAFCEEDVAGSGYVALFPAGDQP